MSLALRLKSLQENILENLEELEKTMNEAFWEIVTM